MLDALSAKLLDPDEKVRAAVCRLYSQLEYEVALHHVSESQWRAVAERGLDKKVIVHVTPPPKAPLTRRRLRFGRRL